VNDTAAVGIIRNSSRIILIKRKTSSRDPWSGQIALPGGHIENGETVEEGLLREIMEEVNIELSTESIVGEMEPASTIISPELKVFPFILDYPDLEMAHPGPEISEIKIVNVYEYEENTTERGLPALNYDGWYVWGMTYRILSEYIRGNFKSYKKKYRSF